MNSYKGYKYHQPKPVEHTFERQHNHMPGVRCIACYVEKLQERFSNKSVYK